MKDNKKYIEVLIEIGQSLNLNDNQRTYLSKYDWVNRQSIETWNPDLLGLSDIDVIYLFKGIVLTEKTLSWIGGSVAAGIWIYKEIERRNLDLDYQIANWALKTTKNPYIPFGSVNYNKVV